MDRQQAIWLIKDHMEHHKIGEYPHILLGEALNMAIAALTQPNETPPCYQPDGDGCAYQCYDGDDEPIDKCKECPLCYSDKQRHHAPPNEALTLEQLREMDGEPVWVDDKKTWALLRVWDDKNIDVVFPMPKGCFHAKSVNGRKIYRRPPEGDEDK